MKKLLTYWHENKLFLLFITLMVVFRSAVADWNHVPTGSMQPTIQIGDQLFVDKLAYDVRVPLTHISLHKLHDPERGDVIIFDSQVSDKRLVKRVVGVPGDQVEMVNNRLIINGLPATYKPVSESGGYQIFHEIFDNQEHAIRVRKHASAKASFNAVIVPENQYLVLGDNRDNSADSRFIGFVPRAEIVGKTETVAFSLNYDNYYLPRGERFVSALDPS